MTVIRDGSDSSAYRSADRGERPSLTLLELNRQVQGVVTREFPDTYLVTAEVAGVRPASRCVFIDLVERQDGRVVAKMGGIAFLGTYERIQREFTDVVGEPFKDGMRVLVSAKVQFQPEYGLQLKVDNIDPSYTLGDAERRKREAVDRLRREGLIDLNKARRFPLVPRYVAIISSRAAAGYEDFVNQLERNPYGFRLVCSLFDTRVQGTAAQASLVSAFQRVRERAGVFDVVVLIRGGGSPTDLDCFNQYTVTSEIARCPLPVIAGIGHERDETLADIVACRSVKTPTAAAELLLSALRAYEDRVNAACRDLEAGVSRTLGVSQVALERIAARLSTTVQERLRQEKEALEDLAGQVGGAAQVCLGKQEQKLASLSARCRYLPMERLSQSEHELALLQQELECRVAGLVERERDRLAALANEVMLCDPENVLRRGYSITYWHGKPLKSASGVRAGDWLETRLLQGSIVSTVDGG